MNLVFKDLEFLDFKEKDIEDIIKLEKNTSSLKFDKEFFKTLLASKSIFGIIIKFNKFHIGHIISSVVLDESEIIIISVLKNFQNKGIAKLLFYNFAKRVNLIGVKKIFLEVSMENFNAKKLYKFLGFIKIGQRKDYYKKNNRKIDAETLCVTPKKIIDIMNRVT